MMKARTNFTKAFLAVATLSAIISLTPKASALSGSQFQAGRIMDDAVFYDASRMAPGDIQHFFNVKVPVCDTNGSQPYAGSTRAAYGSAHGYPPPYTCLKDYRQDTPSRNADSYCHGFSGGSKSAAQIVYEVAQSCGINPQTLIVLLQKEQNLVTDDWPWSVQYRSATGYGCPDSAPCDAQYYGFFNQVYEASRAFKRYIINENSYNYRAQRDNTIKWHPNSACSTSNVFIFNRATAGLYNYTPYRPNQAALGNLYGSGDSCSSYGNRNFWRLFIDWFGNPHTTEQFAWTLESQEIYSDVARTQPYTSGLTVAPGNKMYVRIKARNMGYETWGHTYVRIGTARPNDSHSDFQDSGWLNFARPTQLKEGAVTPGGIGTFEFSFTAPTNPGTYREYFNVVADGYTWMNDIGMQFPIDVVQPTSASNASNIQLASGQQLLPGQRLFSPDRQSVFILQGDGNLVLYSNFKPVWHTDTSGFANTRLVMQGDGNLVLYSGSQALWSSVTQGNAGARLTTQTDGNLVVYSSTNVPLWATYTTHNPDHLAFVNKTLETMFFSGQQIETANRRFRAVLQSDGNFVLYSPNRATWSTGTDGQTVTHAIMRSDGDLVLYNGSQTVWGSGLSPDAGPSRLHIQPDGNLVIYDRHNRATWQTGTAGTE